MLKVRSTVAVLAWLALASPLLAQTANTTGRDGFVIGFGLGFGSSFPCDNCPSGAADFAVGAMATPNVAILADFSVVGNGDDFPEPGRSVGVMTLGVRVWPVERFWLQGGVGIGGAFDNDFDDFDDDFDDPFDDDILDEDTSWAGLAAAGFDVVRKGRFALDVRVRGTFVSGHQTLAFGVGINWY